MTRPIQHSRVTAKFTPKGGRRLSFRGINKTMTSTLTYWQLPNGRWCTRLVSRWGSKVILSNLHQFATFPETYISIAAGTRFAI